MGVTEPFYHRHGMETRPSDVPAEQLPTGNAAAVEGYLATVRREHTRFVEALSMAGAQLGGQSHQLAAASSMQVQLTRQFLDAQRSILLLRADLDHELSVIGRTPRDEGAAGADVDDQGSYGRCRSQLTLLLDGWWLDENELRRVVLARARDAVQRYLAALEAGAVASQSAPVVALPARAEQLLARLDSADPADLVGLLDDLIGSLGGTNAAPCETPVPSLHVAPDAAERPTRELRFIEGAPADGFGEFWVHDPAPVVTPKRWRRRSIAQAVAPTVVLATMLTAVMAWIG